MATNLAELYYRTGVQDCANTFDGDDVPSAEELAETADRMRDDALDDGASSDEADACAAAWVNGWRTQASREVARYAAMHAAADD